jgi:hypothetical protein
MCGRTSVIVLEEGEESRTMDHLTLMIIRHAEKPKRAWPGPGLTIEGEPDGKSLVIRGWQRAGAWSALFAAKLGGIDFPQPGAIYAANPNPSPGAVPADAAETNKESSQRPFETVTPLAARLDLVPVTTWAVGQEGSLVKEITALSGVVLICWEHKRIISHILPKITGGQALLGLPSKWSGKRFDVVLRLDRERVWSFRQLFPQLLSGDSRTSAEQGPE